MRVIALIAFLTTFSPASILASGVLPFSIGGSTHTGGPEAYGFQIYNNVGASTLFTNFFTTPTITAVPFTIDVLLPAAPNYLLSSATLTFNDGDTQGYATQGQTSGSQGTFLVYCDGFTCYYTNSYSPQIMSFPTHGYGILTGITDGSHTVASGWGSGTLDLLALGFGSDLLSGGTLQLTGYRNEIVSPLLHDSGFNAYSFFGGYYDGSGTESASLSINGLAPSPEPGSFVLLLTGCAALGFRRNRPRSAA